jgi:hypothetical protein
MFNVIKNKVTERFNLLSKHKLYTVALDKDTLFNAYLDSFSPEYRQEHNCNCCKYFLRNYGGIIAIVNGKIETLWDFKLEGTIYDKVPEALHKIVSNAGIENIFVSKVRELGTDFNYKHIEGSSIRTYIHFYGFLPLAKVHGSSESIASALGEAKTRKELFQRALETISLDTVDTVIELIKQDSIYRGQEHLSLLQEFRKHKVITDIDDTYIWTNYTTFASGIRNSVIGTLLVDIEEGKPIDVAVTSFEYKVAPANYKRPTALVTKAMIEQAEKTIKSLGYEQALYRRYAVATDLTVNNVLHINRTVEVNNDIFGQLYDAAPENPKNFERVETIPVDTFLKDVLPTLTSMEVLLESKHSNKFMSLVAPTYPEAPNMFTWGNNFSWSYGDNLADTVKERIKKAGGSVEGKLRVSLDWFNYDDLDLSVIEPNREKIYFGHRSSKTSCGYLDIDMNAGSHRDKQPVENIIYPTDYIQEGSYEVWVRNHQKRVNTDPGFNVEVECNGELYRYHYPLPVKDGERIQVITFNYDKIKGITEVLSPLTSTTRATKTVWGLDTNKFHKVSMLLNSPNHWDGEAIGNKHLFFILNKAKNPDVPRGFFNEFLKSSLVPHRKVFELLGSKLKIEQSDNQLSGLGFSSTQRDELILKVVGKTTRVIKLLF